MNDLNNRSRRQYIGNYRKKVPIFLGKNNNMHGFQGLYPPCEVILFFPQQELNPPSWVRVAFLSNWPPNSSGGDRWKLKNPTQLTTEQFSAFFGTNLFWKYCAVMLYTTILLLLYFIALIFLCQKIGSESTSSLFISSLFLSF